MSSREEYLRDAALPRSFSRIQLTLEAKRCMIATAREHSNDCDRTWCMARSVLLACALAAVGAWPAPPAWQLDLPQSIAAAEAEAAEYLPPGQGGSRPGAAGPRRV